MTDHGYYAYGLDRRGGELGTDHRFTGQKLDGVGLQYFNARYYDPELGTFISPDTIVPDGGSVFGYNRYMYARGNPLKYTDPTGHCSTTEPSSSDHQAHSDWTDCWRTADTILQQWDQTDYWSHRYPDKDAYRTNIVNNPDLGSAWFNTEWQQFLDSRPYSDLTKGCQG